MPRTPGPWQVAGSGPRIITNSSGDNIAHVFNGQDFYTTGDANASFIVTACNSYDGHLARIARIEAALRELTTEGNRLAVCCGHLDGDGTFDEVRCWNEATAAARRALAGEEAQ